MGSGVSFPTDGADEAKMKELCGDSFDQEKFNSLAKDGKISVEQWKDLLKEQEKASSNKKDKKVVKAEMKALKKQLKELKKIKKEEEDRKEKIAEYESITGEDRQEKIKKVQEKIVSLNEDLQWAQEKLGAL